MPERPVLIFHNPACGTSRNVLAALREAGHEPTVVEYLKAGWTEETLRRLAERTGVGLRGLLRERGTPAEALGLLDEGVADETLLAAMLAHPNLVNRPIVETDRGAVLARPVERVWDVV